MKQKILHVINFGPVSDARVELRSINMFIGEQSIGKSTLAKLITIFTDYVSLCKLIQGGKDMWSSLLKDYNLDSYTGEEYSIVYEMHEDDKKFYIEILPARISFFMQIGEERITDAKKISNEILKLKPFYNTDEFKKISIDFENRDILDFLTNSLYIPAERIIYAVLTNLMPALALAKSSVTTNLLRFMVELNNAKAEYPQVHIGLLDIEFKHEGTEDSILFDDKSIPIVAASSGIQSLVPLLLVFKYAIEKKEYSSFVIEEPECNLFPTKQVELLKEILKAVKDSDRTLTITTHSPYLLSAMNNILFASMLSEKYGEGIKKYIDEILPEEYQIKSSDCSVYSLGKDINGGVYCSSLLDKETGMIDCNSLDVVSEQLANEFDSLQNSVLSYLNDLHK